MNWYLLIGSALTGWSLMLLLSSERQRLLNEIELKRRESQAAAEKSAAEAAQIPTVR